MRSVKPRIRRRNIIELVTPSPGRADGHVKRIRVPVGNRRVDAGTVRRSCVAVDKLRITYRRFRLVRIGKIAEIVVDHVVDIVAVVATVGSHIRLVGAGTAVAGAGRRTATIRLVEALRGIKLRRIVGRSRVDVSHIVVVEATGHTAIDVGCLTRVGTAGNIVVVANIVVTDAVRVIGAYMTRHIQLHGTGNRAVVGQIRCSHLWSGGDVHWSQKERSKKRLPAMEIEDVL